jgi:inner membrane protein
MGDILPYFGGVWLWWIIAGVLLFGELLLPGVFLLWLAAAAALTGLLDLVLGLGWQGEVVTFVALSVALVLASWNYVRAQRSPKSEQPNLNQRQMAYVGRRTVLLNAISNGAGKARIDDSVWDVTGPDLPKGAQVIVTGVAGATLTVEAIN